VFFEGKWNAEDTGMMEWWGGGNAGMMETFFDLIFLMTTLSLRSFD